MNKIKTILLILFTGIIIILGFLLFKNFKKSNNSTIDNNKIISEVKYLDSKIGTLLNQINGISLENYKVSAAKTSTKSANQGQSEGSSNESSTGTGQKENSGMNEDTGSSGGEGQSNNSNETSQEQNEDENTISEYSMIQNGILTTNYTTDWNSIKNEVERLYSVTPTITLDLYTMDIGQNDILDFNSKLDDLTIAVKAENKEDTLIQLVYLYTYLPKYTSSIKGEDTLTSILETKAGVFAAYALLETDNWPGVIENIKKAQESYNPVINNVESSIKDDTKNKIYIILNELESAANKQDKEVFLIKYKTFLEEIESIEQ